MGGFPYFPCKNYDTLINTEIIIIDIYYFFYVKSRGDITVFCDIACVHRAFDTWFSKLSL